VSDGERLPDFFIAGNPKSGTTALYEMLVKHPQVFLPAVKEPNFFSSEWQKSSSPPESLDDYRRLFDAATSDQRKGDASPFYLSSTKAPEAIHELRPSAQIIAILREPAAFLRSLHLQLLQSDIETERDLRSALALEDRRRRGEAIPSTAGNWGRRLLYSDYLRYAEQLQRYARLFSPERMLVLIYDDFRDDNAEVVRQVLRFLDVDDTAAVATAESNPTERVRLRRLNHAIYAVAREQGGGARAVKKTIKTVMPRRLRQYLWQSRRRLIYSDPPPPDDELSAEIRARFKPEVVALNEYLNRDLVSLWGYDQVD
jgi:hypothetical protein